MGKLREIQSDQSMEEAPVHRRGDLTEAVLDHNQPNSSLSIISSENENSGRSSNSSKIEALIVPPE